jgi:hypothetical protein
MKKQIITIAALLSGITASAQWTTETVDNGFDNKFKVAYVDATDGKRFAKLYTGLDSTIGFMLYEGYVCTEHPTVELTFLVGGKWQAYQPFSGDKSTDSKRVYMLDDIALIEEDFRKATVMKIRLTDDHCGTTVCEFNMTGSGRAIDFMRGGSR